MVKIEINGISISAREGQMVIEAADEAGISIPRFCYHKKLSIAASCRMCLVEVEKVAKPLPACATPVTEGMKVFTRSPKAIAAQKAVMEFLLINHPLDCPICDQGGECDLQEMAVGYGKDVSRFSEGKRVVQDKNIGPLIATDMTRCIHCTRCVRFGQEVAGIMELGATGRGEHMRIGTYIEKSVDSEVSGNIIDLCPVGALTSKPYRFTARPWELVAHPAISPHDCVGANLTLHVRRHEVMRAVARENEVVNESWIADRDRYSYLGLRHTERLTRPMVKSGGRWQETDWDSALVAAVEGLKRIGDVEPANVGALGAYGATTEELYLLQKLTRGIGSQNVDHRLRQQDFARQEGAAVFPWLGQAVADLENLDAALLVGSNVRKEQPLMALRLRKSALKGGSIMFINPMDYAFNFPVAEKVVVSPSVMVTELAAVAKVLLDSKGERAPAGYGELLDCTAPGEEHKAIAARLQQATKGTVLLGNLAVHHPAYSDLAGLAVLVARLAGCRFGYIGEGGNSAGAWLAGAVPHRLAGGKSAPTGGKAWREMFASGVKGYLLLGTEPELDCIDSGLASRALNDAEFVVALTAFQSEQMREYADVLLPIGLFPETSGTFVNAEGLWQSFQGATMPPGEARPGWKVLRVLGNLLDVEGFDYETSEEIRQELETRCAEIIPSSESDWGAPRNERLGEGLIRIVDFPIYSVDPMVRRATALQHTADAAVTGVSMNALTADARGLSGLDEVRVSDGNNALTLPLVIDERVPDGCAYIAAGQTQTMGLGAAYGVIEVSPAGEEANRQVV